MTSSPNSADARANRHASGVSVPSAASNGVTRRALWATVTLLLMAAAFGIGRLADGIRSLPEIAATLPGDEAQFSREFDERIRDRFAVGSSEDVLVD